MSARGETQMAIISNDKGFQAVLDYFRINPAMSEVCLIKAGNIESALVALSSPEDADRRIRLQERSTMLDLAAEHARIEERNEIRNTLREALLGTEYGNSASEIIDFVTARKNVGRKSLYTDSLHYFGKMDGTAIYRIVKQII